VFSFRLRAVASEVGLPLNRNSKLLEFLCLEIELDVRSDDHLS